MAGRQQDESSPEARGARLADLPHIDRLGPLSRAVVSESPIDVWVAQMIAEAPMGVMDPNTFQPDDERFARWLSSRIAQKTGKPAEYFRLAPRRSRLAQAGLVGRRP